jgi:hypothetical protein
MNYTIDTYKNTGDIIPSYSLDGPGEWFGEIVYPSGISNRVKDKDKANRIISSIADTEYHDMFYRRYTISL